MEMPEAGDEPLEIGIVIGFGRACRDQIADHRQLGIFHGTGQESLPPVGRPVAKIYQAAKIERAIATG